MIYAPERIWAEGEWRRADLGRWWDFNPGGDSEEYIRADLLEAHIGAALEEAAVLFQDRGDKGLGAPYRAPDRIRALRPDAMQALERVKREAEQRGEEKWFADAKLMLGFADLAYEVGAMPTSSELIAAEQRVLDRVKREARVDGMRAALAACDPTSYSAHHASVRRRCQEAIRALIATEERGEGE